MDAIQSHSYPLDYFLVTQRPIHNWGNNLFKFKTFIIVLFNLFNILIRYDNGSTL